MSRVCQITGKTAMVGNNVSHSKRRTKRRFYPNLFDKKFFNTEDGTWVNLRVSASGIRLINKLGLKNALKNALKRLSTTFLKVKDLIKKNVYIS